MVAETETQHAGRDASTIADEGRVLMRRRRMRWRALWVMWALYGGVVVIGIVTWMGREPEILTPAFAEHTPDPGDSRLSLWRYGGRVRASSYLWFHGHHPLFAIDGVKNPEGMERWSSAPRDREPWLEVLLPARADVAKVFLALGGLYPQHGGEPARHFVVSCHREQEEVFRAEYEDNIRTSRVMRVACPDVDRVRVTFYPDPPVVLGSEVLSHTAGHWWREQPPDLSVHVWEMSVMGKVR